MSGKKENEKEKVTVTKQSLLAAKEVVGLLKTFSDGDDIEEHLRRLDDVVDLMMVDDLVKYQAMLLSMEESIRGEFNAWLKTENAVVEVKGNPEALKKRLLDKFRVRKSILERVAFVMQPRRSGKRIVADVLERQRVYSELMDELTKNKERLLVEATMQLLTPEDRADYCNLRPIESKRAMIDLLEFIRRKEEERMREESQESLEKKTTSKKKTIVVPGGAKLRKKTSSRHNDDDDTDEESADEERERLIKEGRCFVCQKVGHIAAECPLVRMKKMREQQEEDKKKRVAGATTSL